MTTKICEVVTRVTTASVYCSTANKTVRHVTVSVYSTAFNCISEIIWEFPVNMQSYLAFTRSFLMAELFFGAKIISCHRFNTDERLQYFLM